MPMLDPVRRRYDVGAAGPGNFAGFRKHVIERSERPIRAYLDVSHAGIFAFPPNIMVGESQDLRLMDPAVCAKVAWDNRDVIRGVKIRIGLNTSSANGMVPSHYAIEAAERAGPRVMCHVDRPPPRNGDILEALRPGGVLTHCYRPFPSAPVHADGRVRGAFCSISATARARLPSALARAVLAGGFPPDVIYSDVHVLCIDGPAFGRVAATYVGQPTGCRDGQHGYTRKGRE